MAMHWVCAGNGTLCLIGSYDPKGAGFIRQNAQAVDYGLDFYAPQTLLTPDGRRVMAALQAEAVQHQAELDLPAPVPHKEAAGMDNVVGQAAAGPVDLDGPLIGAVADDGLMLPVLGQRGDLPPPGGGRHQL